MAKVIARHLLLTVALSTHVYKVEPANVMLGEGDLIANSVLASNPAQVNLVQHRLHLIAFN